MTLVSPVLIGVWETWEQVEPLVFGPILEQFCIKKKYVAYFWFLYTCF